MLFVDAFSGNFLYGLRDTLQNFLDTRQCVYVVRSQIFYIRKMHAAFKCVAVFVVLSFFVGEPSKFDFWER